MGNKNTAFVNILTTKPEKCIHEFSECDGAQEAGWSLAVAQWHVDGCHLVDGTGRDGTALK